MFSELDEPISLSEISIAINQLSNGKSAGPDRLINEFLSMESMFYYHTYIRYLIEFSLSVTFQMPGLWEK